MTWIRLMKLFRLENSEVLFSIVTHRWLYWTCFECDQYPTSSLIDKRREKKNREIVALKSLEHFIFFPYWSCYGKIMVTSPVENVAVYFNKCRAWNKSTSSLQLKIFFFLLRDFFEIKVNFYLNPKKWKKRKKRIDFLLLFISSVTLSLFLLHRRYFLWFISFEKRSK